VTTAIQGPAEDVAFALASSETGRVMALTVAAHVPAPTEETITALEILVQGSAGAIVRDDVDALRGARFRDSSARAGERVDLDWAEILSALKPSSAWIRRARLDHAVLHAVAVMGGLDSVDPATIAGHSERTMADVSERFQAWTARELIASEFDSESGLQRYRFPPSTILLTGTGALTRC
jgi:hypothetical protein